MRRQIELVAATANLDKVAEIQAIFDEVNSGGGAVSLVLLPRPDSIEVPEEDADTLIGNARIKARRVGEVVGRLAVADDTGLEVDALDGAPGVHSARFAGPDASYADNTAALLAALAEVPEGKRQARFRTVALVRVPDGSEIVAEGVLEGAIGLAPKGAGGFGYDPVFIPQDIAASDAASNDSGLTLAELSTSQKNQISARGHAFHNLAAALESAFSAGKLGQSS